MKATGIVRKFDENGRFVVPIELRRELGIVNRDDAVEVFAGEDCVILKKYQPSCYFCDSMDDVVLYRDKKICKACIRKLAAAIAAE